MVNIDISKFHIAKYQQRHTRLQTPIYVPNLRSNCINQRLIVIKCDAFSALSKLIFSFFGQIFCLNSIKIILFVLHFVLFNFVPNSQRQTFRNIILCFFKYAFSALSFHLDKVIKYSFFSWLHAKHCLVFTLFFGSKTTKNSKPNRILSKFEFYYVFFFHVYCFIQT